MAQRARRGSRTLTSFRTHGLSRARLPGYARRAMRAADGTRTRYLLVGSQVLYQVSFNRRKSGGSEISAWIRSPCRLPVPPLGLEPRTRGVRVRCSDQLSYGGSFAVTAMLEPAAVQLPGRDRDSGIGAPQFDRGPVLRQVAGRRWTRPLSHHRSFHRRTPAGSRFDPRPVRASRLSDDGLRCQSP